MIQWWVPLAGVGEIVLSYYLVFWKRTWKRGLIGTFYTEKRWRVQQVRKAARQAKNTPRLSAALKMAEVEAAKQEAEASWREMFERAHATIEQLQHEINGLHENEARARRIREKLAELERPRRRCYCPTCQKGMDQDSLKTSDNTCADCVAKALPDKVIAYQQDMLSSIMGIPPVGVGEPGYNRHHPLHGVFLTDL